MPMRKRIVSALIAFVCCITFGTAWGQVTVFSENFENGGNLPSGWSQSYSSPEWQCVSSGIGSTSTPSSAHGGTYCAGMYYNDSDCDWNELLSPYINLSAYETATLTFYLHKQKWGSDVDDLTVYYRNSTGGSWTQLATYTGNINSWTLETVTLPSLSANYQIKFKGNACYGYGIYIDDVVVKGQGSGGSSSSCDYSFNMASGLSRTIECGSTYCFYDSGGEDGSYQNSESYTATFTSQGNITINFSSFVTETSSNCNEWDYITIYDGGTNGTVLVTGQTGCSTRTLNTGTNYTATSGTMTVVWRSDGSGTAAGWVATITASGCGSTPPSDDCITVGTGTSTTYYVPFNSLYGYSFVEQIYTAGEIGTSGQITSVSFYHKPSSTTTAQTNNIVLYMKNVSRSSFSSTTDYEQVTAADIVYSGSWTIPGEEGWATINLSAPFDYDGTSNLLVAMDENTDGYSSRYFTYTSVSNSVLDHYSDSYNPNPYDLGSFSGSKAVRANRANAKFCITEDCTQPTGTFALNPSTINITAGSTYNISNALTNTLTPSGTISYTSSNTGVATVTNGVITGVAEGSTTIRIEYAPSNSGYCHKILYLTVNVNDGCARIGTGSTASSSGTYGGIYTYLNYYAYTQQLYTATELNAAGAFAGTLRSLALHYAETSTNALSFEVYVGFTSQTAVPTSWVSDAGLTLVYSGTISFINEWTSIDISSAGLYWDGSSNILVAMRRTSSATPSGTSYPDFYYTSVDNMTAYCTNTSSLVTLDGNNVSTSTGSTTSQRPEMKFCIDDCIQRTLTFNNSNVSITSCTGTTSQNPTIGGGSTSGTITWSSSNENVATVSSTGVVTAHSTGTAVITARLTTSGDYCGATGSYTVTVTGTSHRLTYNTTTNCTGGTASTAPTGATGTTAVVTSVEPTCSSLPYFHGWNTAADGSGTSYAAGATVDLGCADVTLYAQYSSTPPEITGSPDCESAMAFCASNDVAEYNLTISNTGTDSEGGIGSFLTHSPTWWFLRISESGPINMTIHSDCGDVDFGCWGPFDNVTCDRTNDLTNGTSYSYYDGASQATYYGSSYNGTTPTSTTTTGIINGTFALAEPSGNLVDYGGSTSHDEYLQITNAQEGEIYVVVVANFSGCTGTITMNQTNLNDSNAGRSDCTIVNDCVISSITTIVGDCGTDQTFSVSGNINFTDPPVDGTLTISDGSVSQVFTPPFVSPISYSLNGIQGDGQEHTITAAFASSTTNCERITYIDAPMCEIDCPDATVAMTGYTEVIGDRYYFDVCLGSGVNMSGTQTGYTSPSWRWSINPHGGQAPYVINGQTASYTPGAEQGYDVSLTVTEGQCSSVAYGRIRVSDGLTTSLTDYALGQICVGDSRDITIGGTGSDIQVNSQPHTIETSLGHAEETFIPDGLNCATQCYESSVTFYDFDDGAVVTNADAIKYIKLNTEHSFIGDVQIKITCPNDRSAIILQDYYSNDANSNVYSGNAIDAYTYTWPDMTSTTHWRVGSSSTSYYTGDNMLGRTYNSPEGASYTYNGYTYYLLTFPTSAEAWNYVHTYLERYYLGNEYTVYSINSGAYYAIAYTVTDDNGSTRYYVWMTNDATTGNDAYTFLTQEGAQYYVNTVLGGNGVVSSYTTSSYTRIYFGEPDIYDVVDSENLTSTEICDGSDPHNISGVGYDYAWTSSSQYTTVGYVYDVANMSSSTTVYDNGTSSTNTLHHVIPSNVETGTQMYQPFQSFGNLSGCPLNGTWTISVCDSWAKDNGYVFDWEIALSEDLLPSNWDYTVDLDGVSNDCGSIATVSGNNLIVAPQTATNGEQSCNIILSDNLGCTTNIPMTYTAVAPTITHVATSGNEMQTVCEGQQITDIVYTLGGVAVGATISWSPSTPDGLTMNVSGNTVTVSGAPTEHNTYNYTITTVSQTGLRCTEQTATGRIIVNEGNIVPTFTQAGPYCEGSTVNALPTTSNNGITGTWSPAISNRPNTYTFTPDPGQCATITTMQIVVNPLPTLEYTSGSETLCKGETDANIVFTYGGGANGADVTGLPTGMEFNTDAAAQQIVISGIPTAGAGTYSYTITTTGATSPCSNISRTRTITIIEPATLELTSGNQSQTVCEGDAVNFVYTYGGSAGGATASDLPSGLTASLNTTNHTLTISGNPTEEGTFTVTTSNVTAPCGDVSLTGTVVITNPAELTLLSASPDAVLCQNGEWDENIQYQFGGTATGATVTGLPSGINYSVSGNVVTISGMPTDGEGSYTYTVTTTSDASSPCPPKTLTGTIEISTNATLVLTSAEGTDGQVLCLPNQTFSTIVYTYGGGATGADVSDMPDGLTATVNTTAHTVTIAGVPSEVGQYYYSIVTTGTIEACKPAGVYGNITIGIDPTLDVTGNRNQSFCLGNSMNDIVFTYGGGATGVSVTGTLPAGVSADTDDGAQTLTLSGIPTETGTFNITVSTTGASDSWNPCEEKSFPVTITVYDTPDVSINASTTEICNGSSVNLSAQPASFSTYRWSCNTTSDATYTVSTGLPTSVTVSAISVSPTVTPGSTDVEYNLRVTDGNGCSAEVQQIITVSATPTADIVKDDNTRCTEPYNGSVTISNFEGGLAGSTYTVAVTGQTSQTTTGASVVFGGLEAGSYTVTITNESTLDICYTEQTITIGDNQSSPSVDISGAPSICEGTNTTLAAHASGGVGTIGYLWSTGATGSEITTPDLTTATTYSVVVTDENGCTASDEFEVQIGAAPDVEAVANTSICFGDSDVLIANVHNAGSGYTLRWSASPSENSGLLTTTGERITVTPELVNSYTYTVTLTSTACGGGAETEYTSSVTVEVNDLPKPNIINLSEGVETITCDVLEINVEATGGTSYVWSNGVNVAGNTFTEAGIYTVTVSSADACTASTQIQIYRDDALPNVSISASPSTELTCDNPTITLTASSTTDGASLSWTTMDVTVPNVYSVTAEGTNGCPATAEIEITSDNNLPTVSIDEPTTVYLTCTNQSITLTATGQGTLTWSPSNVATTEGDYTVTARADNGCESSDVIHIYEDNDLPNVEITPSAPSLTCTVQTITLQASGAANYVWNGDHTGAFLTITAGGEYTVVGTAANGCSDTETIIIGQDAGLPEVSINPPTATLTCSVNSVELTAVAESGIVFDWGDVDPTNITEPGTYSVTATAPNGCQRAATATVAEDRVNPDVAITPPATTVLTCYNSYNNIPITLEATSTSGASLSWTNGTLDVTTPGHYSVTATASNDCESTAEIEITEDVAVPNVAIGNNSNTNVLTCAGPSISVTLIDDSDADDYVWSGGENLTGTGNSFTSPGHYYVTATAPNGCTSEAEINIREDVATPTVNITNNTGTSILSCDISIISVTAVGSDRVVAYSWSGGTYTNQAPNEFTTIGTYVVTATADNGCTATASIDITETMGRPNVVIDAPDPAVLTCTTTQIPLTATGNAVSYVWSGGMYPDDASNIVENTGVYTVTATADNGCTAVASISITENLTPPTVSIRNESGFNQIDCNASSVHAIATGTGVSYIWPGGYEGAEIDLTAAGTYTVTAYGANGCPNTAYVVITEDFTPPTPSITSANSQYIIDCTHGELTLNATGGITYEWSTGDNGPSIVVTRADTYRVTATGLNGCPGETEIVIDANNTAPNAYIDNLSGTYALSCNVNSIDVIAQGGIQYAWNNQLWGGGASQSITTPGTYIVTVTGRNGCYATASITIENDRTPPTVNINSTNNLYELNCSVSRINVTASGNGISYDWSGGSNTTGYTNVFTNPGPYTVTSTGFNGCTNTATVTITANYSAPEINISNESGTTVLDCNTQQIHVVVTGQNATYMWNDGYTTADRTFYSHGQYTVTATGANGCSASLSIGITENMVQPTVSITNNTGSSELNCINTSISLTANGGQSYAWNDGTMSSTNAISTPGMYTVTATAANGCTNTATVTISQAPVFNAEITNIGTISCYGESTSVTVTATGGNPAYNYEWSNGQNTQTATGLLAGSYTVTVRDSGGCSVALQCNVTQPLEMQASIVSRDLICGVSQGSLSAVVIGGTQPYSYTWSNGITTVENTNVIVGQYGLTVVDINNCMATANARVSMQGMLSVNAHVTQQISCHGYNDGIVAAEAPNAAEPLFYTWSTGNASPEIYNLFEGSYMVTVTDAWGCTGQAGVNLVSPPEMNLQTYTESPLCYNSRDGKIVATAFGGIAPYSYLWNTSVTENELVNVGMGTYSLTISDAAGCSAVKSVTLDAPYEMLVETTTSDIRCNGDKDGKIEVEVSGGVEPYNYLIEGLAAPSTNNVFSNMTAGYYNIKVVDNNGCVVVKPTLLSQPDVLQVETLIEHPFCRGSRTGSIELKAIGGTEPYMYYWNNSKGDVSIMQNMYAGEYVVGVIDGNECKSDEITITLTDVDVPCLRIPNVFTPNGDGVNDIWEIVNIEMFPEAEIYVFNRWGQLMFTSKGYTEQWDGSYRGHFVPAGTYMYIIDLFNDEEPYEGTVTIIY